MNTPDSQVPEVKAMARAPIMQPIGSSGLNKGSGYIREEFLRELQGRQGRRIYDEMSKNDATVGAILFAIKSTLRAMSWDVEPSDENDRRAVEAAELVEQMLFTDMIHTWPEFIDDVLSMMVYGFSVFEIVWKKRDGRKSDKMLSSMYDDGLLAPQGLFNRSQKTIERWIYDERENPIGFVQYPYDSMARVVPLSRCMHFRTTSELNNPEGQSMLRTAYRSWYWLKRLQEIEGIGTERDLVGYPVLKVPGDMLDPNATTAQQSARMGYESFLQRVRRDQQEGVLIPSDRDESGNPFYEFELLSSGGSRQLDIDTSIKRYETNIARSVLADFLILGSGTSSGSLALGDTKVQFFAEGLEAVANHITARTNNDLIDQIWEKNGFDHEIKPKVYPGEINQSDIDKLAKYVTSLAGVGYDLATDSELENYLRKAGDLPPRMVEEERDFFDPLTGEMVPLTDAKITEAEMAQESREAARQAAGPQEQQATEKLMKAVWGQDSDVPAATDSNALDWAEMWKGYSGG